MVIDTSAVLAILLGEPEERDMAEAMAGAESRLLSAASLVEIAMVALSRRPTTLAEIEHQLTSWGVEIVPVSVAQARLAADGFARFGRGRHPAKLNFGDCFAYALARERGEPLLFKGDGFARTDVVRAL
jgi:ribonuclease VapC